MFGNNSEEKILKEILSTLQRMEVTLTDNNALLRVVVAEQIASKQLLQQIVDNTNPSRNITSFLFEVTTMLPIAPGFSPVITASPVPVGAVLAPGTAAVSTSSDTTNAPITTDASGLIITVAIPTTAVVGTAFTLTTTYTNADGVVATSTSQPFTIVAVVTDITGFTFAQTA